MGIEQRALATYFGHAGTHRIVELLVAEYIKQYGLEILAKIDAQAIGNAITARVMMELGARLGLSPDGLVLQIKSDTPPPKIDAGKR